MRPLFLALSALVSGCGGSSPLADQAQVEATGGDTYAATTEAAVATGGSPSSGGTSAVIATGGATLPATGGAVAIGGTSAATGGKESTGGSAAATGGRSTATGGAATGGSQAAGGITATGGASVADCASSNINSDVLCWSHNDPNDLSKCTGRLNIIGETEWSSDQRTACQADGNEFCAIAVVYGGTAATHSWDCLRSCMLCYIKDKRAGAPRTPECLASIADAPCLWNP